MTLVLGRDFALVGAGRNLGPQRPDLDGDWELPGGRSRGDGLARCFNTDAFTRKAGPGTEGQFGNAGLNIITGTGDIVTTLAIQKRFLMPMEGHAVEPRGDIYDLLNRPRFENRMQTWCFPPLGES